MKTSLHKRITLGVISYGAALFLSLLFLESYFIRSVAEYYVSTRLEHDNESLLAALQPDPENRFYQLEEKFIYPIYQRPFSGHYFKMVLPDQILRSRSLWDEPLNIPFDQPKYPALLTLQGPQRQPLLVFIQQYNIADDAIIIATAESLAQLHPLIRQAQFWSAGAACLLIIIFVLLQYRWMIVSISPLQNLLQQLKELQQGKRQQLDVQHVFAELEPLIAELNQLIVALDARIMRSRSAMGNLAHSLKAPMAALQQLYDSNSPKDPEFIQKFKDQLQILNNRIDNELKRARIAGGQGKRGQLHLRDEIIDLVSTIKNINIEKDINIQIHIIPETYIVFDRQDFLELAGNLLDNAFKWANHNILISATIANDFQLIIEDDGPGCAPEELALLTQRGRRLDERKPGYGLGLSIVQDIIDQYDGKFLMSQSSLGGLLVKVSIPQNI